MKLLVLDNLRCLAGLLKSWLILTLGLATIHVSVSSLRKGLRLLWNTAYIFHGRNLLIPKLQLYSVSISLEISIVLWIVPLGAFSFSCVSLTVSLVSWTGRWGSLTVRWGSLTERLGWKKDELTKRIDQD